MTTTLPMYPWTDGEGEEGWFEGIDLSFDTWKYDEEMLFDDAELVWQELLDRLVEEDVSLTTEQQRIVRPLFDRLWATYANKKGDVAPGPEAPPVPDKPAPDATDVDLTNQGITAIPEWVFKLPNLRRLAIDGLSMLPDQIGELDTLKELDLSKAALTGLPATIGRLTQLRILHLYGYKLHSLPKQLGDLVSLQTLQLSYLSIPLPDSLEGLRSLTNLDLSHLNYDRPAELPPVINRLSALRRLSLANARLTGIPDDILALTSLEELDLTCSVTPRLNRLPELAQLPHLRILRFSGRSTPAQRHHLLDSVWPITTLEELYLDRWGEQKIGGRVVRPALTTLPDDAFTRTPRLRRLDLSFNELTSLPESLYGLTHLEYINLSHTKLDAATVDRLREALPELHVDQ
ncbi:leucine-rich repeat domain-containing protein [Streptomyces gelaticus]